MKLRFAGWIARVRLILLSAAIAFGVFAVVRDWEGFMEGIRRIGLLHVTSGLVAIVVGLIASAEVWRGAVRAVAGPIDHRDARRIFFPSQLGKYLPGGVWTILAQMERAKHYGLSHSKMGISAVLFLVFHMVTGLLMAVVVLPWAAPSLFARYSWILVLAPILVWLLTPSGLVRITNWILTIFRRPKLEEHLSMKSVMIPNLWMVVVWLAYGLSLWILLRPMAGSAGQASLFAVGTSVFALSWIVGVVVVLAPAGIGARELVLFLALTPLVGERAATAVAITLRALHTVADVGLAIWVGWPYKLPLVRKDGSSS